MTGKHYPTMGGKNNPAIDRWLPVMGVAFSNVACGGRRLWLKPTGCQIQTCSNRFGLEPALSGLSLAP